MNTNDDLPSTIALKLYVLITEFQTTEGEAQQTVQAEINALLKGYSPEQISVLKEEVMGVAAQVLAGTTVIMAEPKDGSQALSPAQARKQARENFLKSQVTGLDSNLPKNKLMKVVRAYHAPEQREIAFLGPDYKPEEGASVFFSFREAVYALRFRTEEDRWVGKGPYRLDHVSGELHQERRKNPRVHGNFDPCN